MKVKKSQLVILMVLVLPLYNLIGIFLFFPIIDPSTLNETAFHSLVITVTLISAYVVSNLLSTQKVSRILSRIDRKLIFEKDVKSEFLSRLEKSFKFIYLFKFILAFITVFFALESTIYFFTFIHELNHASSTILLGGEVIELKVVSPRNGNTLSTGFSNVGGVLIFLIAGSLGNIIVFSLFLTFIVKKRLSIKIELFIPLYFIFSYNLLDEIGYWGLGFLFLVGDAGLFLLYNPYFYREICIAIVLFLWFFALLLLLKFGLGNHFWKKITEKVRNFMNPRYSSKSILKDEI